MGASRPFEAAYPGVCPECLDDIDEGDMIVMTDEGAVHEECYDDPDALPLL